MLQYRILLETPDRRPVPTQWAYQLYAWLLKQVPEIADRIHESSVPVLSQYIVPTKEAPSVWVLNLLDDSLDQHLAHIIQPNTAIHLHSAVLTISRTTKKAQLTPEQLMEQGRREGGTTRTLLFQTTASFKQAGRFTIVPTPFLILQNLWIRWNACFPENPIFTEEEFRQAADHTFLISYQLRSGKFPLKTQTIPGFCGSVTLDTRLPNSLLSGWRTLLEFAEYAGVGVKTTLGMGGTECRTTISGK